MFCFVKVVPTRQCHNRLLFQYRCFARLVHPILFICTPVLGYPCICRFLTMCKQTWDGIYFEITMSACLYSYTRVAYVYIYISMHLSFFNPTQTNLDIFWNHHVRLSVNICICHFCPWSMTFKTKATVVAQDPMAAHDPDMRSFDHCQGHIIINMAFIQVTQRGSEFVLVISSFIKQT